MKKIIILFFLSTFLPVLGSAQTIDCDAGVNRLAEKSRYQPVMDLVCLKLETKMEDLLISVCINQKDQSFIAVTEPNNGNVADHVTVSDDKTATIYSHIDPLTYIRVKKNDDHMASEIIYFDNRYQTTYKFKITRNSRNRITGAKLFFYKREDVPFY